MQHILDQVKNMVNNLGVVIPKYCDKCGVKHEEGDMEVVENDFNKSTIRLQCKGCGNSYMIHLSTPTPGVLSAKKLVHNSDMSYGELKKFDSLLKINSDEVLDVFSKLKSINSIGDFNDIIKSN